MTALAALLRYWHTVKYLKPVQWYGRAWFRLHRPRPDLRAAPPLRAQTGTWATPIEKPPCQIGPQRFRFLNESHDCAAATDWNNPSRDKLWLYNLHYFDDLNAEASADRNAWHRGIVTRWIAENPPGHGNGWEPYPCSLRSVNWIKWALAGQLLSPIWQHSLSVQTRWLMARLEVHLLGNHLFANAKALLYCGLFFDGEEAAGWLRCGLRILQRELAEQVLPDGGHFERSPMYHALMLEDVLDLLNVIRTLAPAGSTATALAPRLEAVVSPMLYWLATMTHPDGTLGHFNDAAQGIAPGLAPLRDYALRLGLALPAPAQQPLMPLRSSGYVRAALGPAVALLDVAPIGPDYLPGHAHADTLSFELSLAGRRLIVNGGTSCYGTGPVRQRERSTASHSTVQVADQDSSQVWAGFRVGRRARPSPVQVQETAGAIEVSCSHDGYGFLPGRPRHERTWTFEPMSLQVTDTITNAALPALARYIIAPGLSLDNTNPDTWQLTAGALPLARIEVHCGVARLEAAHYASGFGMVEPTQCLTVALADGRAATRWTWLTDAHTLPER